jgi:hypothetical protein
MRTWRFNKAREHCVLERRSCVSDLQFPDLLPSLFWVWSIEWMASRAVAHLLSLFALFEQPAAFTPLRGMPNDPVDVDPNGVNNAANSLFVIAFSAPLGLLWVWLSKRKHGAQQRGEVRSRLPPCSALAFYVFYVHHGFLRYAEGMTSLEVFTLGYFW